MGVASPGVQVICFPHRAIPITATSSFDVGIPQIAIHKDQKSQKKITCFLDGDEFATSPELSRVAARASSHQPHL
jgi:hypothetical protein